MELKKLPEPKQRRILKWKREPRNYRLTKFTLNELSWMSDAFETSETAIVEAAINRMYEAFNANKIEMAFGEKDAFDTELIRSVQDASNGQVIADKFNI